MKGKLFQSFILAIVVFSCINQPKKEIKEGYNFSITYNFPIADSVMEDNSRFKYSVDTLYLFVEESFKLDTLKIFVDGKLYRQILVTSELSMGLADVVKIGNIEDIRNLGIAVNNSPVVSFELFDKKMNLIGVEKIGKKIEVCFYKKVPSFY